MCGIAGEFTVHGKCALEPVAQMLSMLTHRGPDGAGIFAQNGLTIGSTRLAITGTDVVPLPMIRTGSPQVLAYNGELYGLTLSPETSDTEWFLQEFAHRGEQVFWDLDGMYAGALADPRRRELWLLRDPFGIKPLFVHTQVRQIRFASELAALWAVERSAPVLDPLAFVEYLSFGRRLGEETPFPLISSLAPGTWRHVWGEPTHLRWRDTHFGRYALMPEDALPAMTASAVCEAIRMAIHACFPTNQPVGLLLSGGIDSSVLATLLAHRGVEHLHTFSLLLHQDGVRALSELALPGSSWRSWSHHSLQPTLAQIDEAFEQVLRFTSEPCFPVSAVYTWLLMQMAAREGVRVVIVGEGADELFGGYDSYLLFLNNCSALTQAEDFYLDSPILHTALSLVQGNVADIRQAIRERLAYYARDEVGIIARLLQMEQHVSLRPLLDRIDQTSMQCSLEARVPYLHAGLPSIAWQAARYLHPAELQTSKPLLREAAEMLIGPRAWSIPKRPLRVSLQWWLTGERLRRLSDALRISWVLECLPCRADALQALINMLLANPEPAQLLVSIRLYQLVRFLARFTAGATSVPSIQLGEIGRVL